MTPDEPDAAGLTGFRDRLRRGIGSAAARGRPADLEFRDDRALQDWPGNAFAALEDIRDVPWSPGGEPFATIEKLTAKLQAERPFLAAVLFSPHMLLNRLLSSYGVREQGPVDTWLAMCWTAEAAWSAVTDGLPAAAGYAEGDAGLLLPLAARLRFLVLSEPMRSRAQTTDGWWVWAPDRVPGGSRALGRTFGESSWHLLVARCQEARRAWRGYLEVYQSHPLLSQAKPAELEGELAALAFSHGHSWGLRAPLGLSVRSLAEYAPLTAEDKAVLADVTDQHLLPRFDLPGVARLALYDDSPWRRWARVLLADAVVLAAAAAVICTALLLVHAATIAAAACYLLIFLGVLFITPGWGAMWLLRMPAASAVGIIALISLLPGRLLGAPPEGWVAVAALAVVSFGYLLVEVRNHGVARGTALWRALLVALGGAAHALMVSLIGLVVVAPAFVNDGRPCRRCGGGRRTGTREWRWRSPPRGAWRSGCSRRSCGTTARSLRRWRT